MPALHALLLLCRQQAVKKYTSCDSTIFQLNSDKINRVTLHTAGKQLNQFGNIHFHSPLLKILAKPQTTIFTGQTPECITMGTIHLFAILAICIIALLLCKEFLCGFQVTKIMTLIPCVGIRVKMPRHNVWLIVILFVKQCRVSIAYFENMNVISVHYSSPFESCNQDHLPSVLLVLHPCCCWMKCKVCHAVLAAFHRVLYISILCRTYR
nr:MAG TPA: hypothetical protein [Bacteriophage sp.]